MKRFFSLTGTALLFLVLASGLAGAAAEAEEGSAADDPTVIRWFGTRGVPGPDAPIPPMLEELVSQKVGFDVRFDIYGAIDNHMEIIQLNLAANDLPDLFHAFEINEDFLRQASAKFELAEMEEHMPESTKWLRGLMNQLGLDEAATWATYQDASDGRMWGTPRIWDLGWVPSGQMWRKDILDDLGYEIPATIAETAEVFAAYKAAFPSKYPMGASGKSPWWQAFDQVFNAYGITAGGQGVRDGMIKQHFTFPEFKEALATLSDWYAKGYIDPEFITHTNVDKFRVFAQGDYLTSEWMGRGNWTGDENARFIGELFHNVPGAVAVPATHIARDADSKPLQRVWNPFLTQLIVFGKHLDDDHEHMHRIMQVADVISQDRETKLLAEYGIEGEHYTIPEGETAPQLLPAINALSVADRTEQFGFGFYWGGTFSTYSLQSSVIQNLVEEHVLDPNGIYGANNLDLWFPVVGGAVRYEDGEDIGAMMAGDAKLDSFVMTVQIVTGERPLDYYDEWLEYYYANGGRDWETHATRLYLK